MIERILCLAIGYGCGLVQTSYLLGRLHGIDIREHGSGNAGSTNALRTMGRKAGAITLLTDCLKCVLAVVLARILFESGYRDIIPLLSLYAAGGCILGHNFPVYLNFKGGKGIAASVGLIIAFDYRIFMVCFVVFFLCFFTTHYVSLASLLSYAIFFVGVVIAGQLGSYGMGSRDRIELYVLAFLLMALAFWRHRANVVRLLHKEESKVYLSRK